MGKTNETDMRNNNTKNNRRDKRYLREVTYNDGNKTNAAKLESV